MSVWQPREDAPCLCAEAAREGIKGIRLSGGNPKRDAPVVLVLSV